MTNENGGAFELSPLQLVTMISSPALYVDCSGSIVEVNASMCKFLNEPKAHLLGQAVFEIASNTDRARVEEFALSALRDDLESGQSKPLQISIGTNDAKAVLTPVRDKSGASQGLLLQTDGVALLAENQLWERAITNGRLGVWGGDYRSGHLYHSPSWWSIRGFGPEDKQVYCHEKWLEGVHPDDREKMSQGSEIWGQMGNEYRECRYRERNRDGDWIWIFSRGQILRKDPEGRLEYVVGIDVEITEIVNAEQQRAELVDRLNHAERLNSLGQLAGGIAHDFNNILGVISGNTEMLSTTTPKNTEHFDAIMASVDRGGKLTKRLLAFSRKQPLHQTILRPDNVLDSLIAMLRPTLEANISLEIVCDDDIWNFWADKVQLENALLNLALNARDAMQSGGNLKIVAKNIVLNDASECHAKGLKPGQYVSFEVLDTGEGMTPETIGRAFEPFFTTKELEKGTGLGLSIAFGFAKQSNGHVEIESEIGRGTCLRMYLPSSQDQLSSNEHALNQNIDIVGVAGQRIMVVEDDPLFGELLVKYLNLCGYDVCLFENADDALVAFFDDDEIDLLLTDIALPGEKNGFAMASELRAKKKNLRVLYMSGYNEDVSTGSENIAPDCDYIEKPFSLKTLAKRIECLLGAGTE